MPRQRAGAMICFGRIITCTLAALSVLSVVNGKKYKLCVVDGAEHKKSGQYCPILAEPDSSVECVVASDRMDCLRRLSKGTADFSVFTAEDLVTAQNSEMEILITNELRFSANDTFEYEIVAVFDNRAGIESRHDLKGKRYCHPGYGYETDWTTVLSNYFEGSVVTPSCDPKLSITENRIKATAEFFRSACKAGPWVQDKSIDSSLKMKYPHLCELCGDHMKCSKHDLYWGRRGSLLCLSDGAGDISWARLDDVKPFFGLVPGSPGTKPEGYSFLCPDDTILPVNTTKPCVWVVKPWPVVATKRVVAQDVQEIVSSLSQEDRSAWRFSLLKLLQAAYTKVIPLDVEPVQSYLSRATGFLSANSFSGCHPPRTIRICTTSIIENAKCAWMRESAVVYGVEPDIDCIKADNTTHCMMAVNVGAADVVMVPADLTLKAVRDYNLTTLFYEMVIPFDRYLVVAITRRDSEITSFKELRGKKACFPVYDGVAWNSVKNVLFEEKWIQNCPLNHEMADFFGPSCTPGLPSNESSNLNKICQETFDGEMGAMRCLISGAGDVAFVSRKSIEKFFTDEEQNNPGHKITAHNLKVICESHKEPCHISWAHIGQGMVRANSSNLWTEEASDVFSQLDNLFGKHYASLTTPFTMFGKYDEKSNLLFHDITTGLRKYPLSKNNMSDPLPFDNLEFPYEKLMNIDKMCIKSLASKNTLSNFVSISVIAILANLYIH